MASANKRKGTAFESAVRDLALERKHRAVRPAPMGAGDIGDVHVDGLVCVQAKDAAQHRFSEWLADVAEQRERAGMPFGVIVAKKRRAAVSESYSVMTLDTLLRLLKRLDIAEDMLRSTPYVNQMYQSLIEDKDLK